MDDLFQDKLLLLQLYYPTIQQDILKEFLTSCDGDVETTRNLIDGKPRPKKRHASAQASLTSFVPLRASQNAPKKVKLEEASDLNHKDKFHVEEPNKNRKLSKVITLNTAEDVKNHLYPYASLHLNFLPESVSEKVVDDFVQLKDKFIGNKFYLFGKQCQSNSATAVFSKPSAAYSQLVYNGLERPKPNEFTKSMEEASRIIEEYMNEKIIPNSEKLSWQSSDPWTSDFWVVNSYEKLQNNMAWHSDRLSHIGPHNYVASVSLGTTRMFRLRSTYKDDAPIYQVPLPHNSLFIMHAGCQEEFKHCLSPMSKAIDVHPALGTSRFGITARYYPTFFIENLPKCKCNLSMVLRRSYRSVESRGKYFWSCEAVYQNKGCTSFHWCDFTNVEGHYIAKSDQDTSTWIAPEDIIRLKYIQENS